MRALRFPIRAVHRKPPSPRPGPEMDPTPAPELPAASRGAVPPTTGGPHVRYGTRTVAITATEAGVPVMKRHPSGVWKRRWRGGRWAGLESREGRSVGREACAFHGRPKMYSGPGLLHHRREPEAKSVEIIL